MSSLTPTAIAVVFFIASTLGSTRPASAVEDLSMLITAGGLAGMMISCDNDNHGLNRINRLTPKSQFIQSHAKELEVAIETGVNYNTFIIDGQSFYKSCDEWKNDGFRNKGKMIFDGFMMLLESN